MNSVSERLAQVKMEIRDQADYVQHLLEQFDLPYDACCTLQCTVDDLKNVSDRIRFLLATLPRAARKPRRKVSKKKG